MENGLHFPQPENIEKLSKALSIEIIQTGQSVKQCPLNMFLKQIVKKYYKEYNATMDLIEKYESENKIIVLRPSKLVKVKRVEKNINKLQSIYDLGVFDCIQKLDKIKEYICPKTKAYNKVL